jgi:surfeit locus 1 family protein
VTTKAPARFWLVTLATAAGMAATLALGTWQMNRAGQKLALQAAIEHRMALPPISDPALLTSTPAADLLHRPVMLRGTWIGEHTVFLDNRQMRGKPGFYVVTPLKLEGSGAVVLVERGWAARDFVQRDKLPAIQTPQRAVEVRGRMAPPPGKLYDFAGASGGPIRQNLDLADFRAETGLPLLPLSVQQVGAPSEGLLREWPVAASGVEKHYGYTFQWWALSALIAILYAWFQFIAPRRKPPHA